MLALLEIETYREDAVRVVQDVFRTMLGIEVEPVVVIWPPEDDLINVTVHYAGAWKGALLLECTRPQACAFTGRLLGTNPPDEVNDDVRDAVGELANMIAGNLKPVLPPGVALSMPTLVEGTDYALRILGGNLAGMIAFRCCVGAFWVSLIQAPDDGGSRSLRRPSEATD
ncbi:MAG: chemotaxis protein CheX [Bryobacterales bacterium]|nr:chemotaxis protein CheX [Bryobacteraceae bacterium]MDW8130112.1 chemotaxis protein CheX [Bryobacterales bacterium]